jgi:hypothetical protein
MSLPVCIADVDKNKELEIIYVSQIGVAGPYQRRCHIYKADGTELISFDLDKESDSNIIGPISVGNLDNDSNPEIIIGDAEYLSVYRYNGKKIWDIWLPPEIATYIYVSGTVTGDITGDGYNEILFGGSTSRLFLRDKVFALNRFGNLVSGWPKITCGVNYGTPTLADLDDDGDIEVAEGSLDGRVYIWDLPASYSKSCLDWPMYQHDSQRTGLYQPYNEPPVLYGPYNILDILAIAFGYDTKDLIDLKYSWRVDKFKWTSWTEVNLALLHSLIPSSLVHEYQLPNGTHTLQVRVKDKQGATTVSEKIEFTVILSPYNEEAMPGQ